MKSFQRVMRLAALLIVGGAAAGCVVLPHGGHHRGYGPRYIEPQGPTVIIDAPRHHRPPHRHQNHHRQD